MTLIPILVIIPDITYRIIQLNFFPSPVECLIYREHLNPMDRNQENLNEDLSERKMNNDFSTSKIIITKKNNVINNTFEKKDKNENSES